MSEWLIIGIVVGLIYKLSKIRVIHLEFGEREREREDRKPKTISSKRKQLKK